MTAGSARPTSSAGRRGSGRRSSEQKLVDIRRDTALHEVGYYVTPELFRLLGVAPMSGRHFSFEDGAPPGLETTVMLTHGLWQGRFGGDVSIVGRAVIINDRPHTVVGVMPPGFRFPDRAEVYLPLRLGSQANVMVYSGGSSVMNTLAWLRIRLVALLTYVS